MSTRRRSAELGVQGWVRNRPDGRVEGEAWGALESMENFVKWLHKGSPHGRVDDVEMTREGEAETRPREFGTRY